MKLNIFFIIGLILITDISDTVSQLFLKSSINSLEPHVNSIKKAFIFMLRLSRMPRVWFGFLLSTFSLGFWLFVLSKADLNFAFSLDSMRYILIALASSLFLKEKISRVRWLGIACVVFGIMLVAAG
jgi:drug/metabolite transporter (DMT)-like permease